MKDPLIPILIAGSAAVIAAHLDGSVAAARRAADWLFGERGEASLAAVNPLPDRDQQQPGGLGAGAEVGTLVTLPGIGLPAESDELNSIGLELGAQG